WVWRGQITDEGIIEQLDGMVERGIRGLYILPSPSEFSQSISNCEGEKKYLSDEYMAQLRFAIEEAEKRGIQCWMYDEGGYPSGAANGLVVKNNPELEAFGITANGEIKVIPPVAQPYPDLLNRKSTELFVKYTHETYKKAFGGEYGKHFPITFTDEPHVYSLGHDELVSWTENFDKRFLETYGYDIVQHLDALFGDEAKCEEDRQVRVDYKDLISRLFTENYFMVLRDWCRENGSLSGGHVGGDDVAFGNAKWGYHHILRCLRAMDVPGVDIIWRQAFPGPEMKGVEPYAPLCANRFFPRYASSAAHQTGARLALTESFAIYGAGITYDQMRWVYNFQVVRGLNILNPMNIQFQYAGDRVARTGQPTFAPNLPGYRNLRPFNEWAARVNYLMSAGKPIVEAALFMPMRDIWPWDQKARVAAERFEDVGSQLERRGCDMDVVDEDAILAAEIKNGALCVGDATYKVLYLQDDTVTLTDIISQKLDAFRKAGGIVTVCTGDYVVEPIVLSDCDVRATRRRIADGTLYYITNEAFHAKTGRITFPYERAEKAIQIDAMTGKRTTVSVLPYVYDIPLGGEVILLFPHEAVTQGITAEPMTERSLTLSDFRYRRLRRVKITPDDGFVSEYFHESWNPILLGDWRAVMGKEFSGDVEYRTTFAADEGMRHGAMLDLGRVNYSCEVILNGQSLGSQIFTPHRIPLPPLQAENELIICVSNTLANEYVYHDFGAWILNYQPGYMEVLQKNFNEESLESGLYGPVRILW
ncbi:MAG: hypothetical protein IJP14_02480, partial [Clostridia bacterium]|nr:hypothetical protein [Clostridia bacterium]